MQREDLRQRTISWALGALGVIAAFPASAGDRLFDFSQDPASIGIEVKGNNDQPWLATGGKSGGFLALTYSQNSQFAAMEFPDIDDGKIVTAFRFTADLRVGNPNGNGGRPADGFSVSFARSTDPLVTGDLANTGAFAGGIPEGGATTGIAVCFDTWSGNTLPDGADIEGIIVRVDNRTVNRTSLPTRNGACEDPTSLQTGPYNQAYWDAGGDARDPQAWADLCWQELVIDLNTDAKLTVSWKGRRILDNFQTSFFPSAGKLLLAGRTGGANENTHFDNIRLVTTAAAADSTPPSVPSGLAVAGVSTRVAAITWNASTDNSGKVAYEVERNGVLLTSTVLTSTRFTDTTVKPNTAYSYTVRALDPAGNKSAASAALAVRTEVETLVQTPGFLKFETWLGIGGTAVDSLVSDARYPDSPDFVGYVSAVDTRIAYPDDSRDNYGGRMSGLFTAPETGQFRFFLRSDDASQLWLSTDDKEANLAQIAEETGCCNAFTEPDSPRTSEPVALTAGRKYAFQVLWKEGGGGDFAQVAMRKEGDSTAAAVLKPIAGSNFSTLLDPNHGAPLIQESPASLTVAAGASATFSVKALGKQPLTYQWRRNGADIPGATSASYTVASADGSNFGSYSVVVGNFEGSTTSGSANLVVTGLPTALFIHASAGPNASDLAAIQRIQTLGLQVVPMGATTSQTGDAVGKAVVVISSTLASSEVGDKFRQSTTPVVNWEAALQDNFDETDRAGDADGSTRGVTGGQTQLNIVKADHPLAAGLKPGLFSWSSGQDVSWGVVGPGAIVIATVADNPDRAAVYLHPVGAKLFDGSVNPGLRIHIPGGDNTFVGLSADGLKIFDAAIKFAANIPDKSTLLNGLVAYWNFDGHLYDSVKDFDGTARGKNPIAFVDGKAGFGKSLKLDGTDQFVEITGGDENELEFPRGSMSISGWFKVGAFDTAWQAIIAKGEGSNYRVARRAETGTIAYAGGVGEGANDVPAVNDGNWHHFVAVSDATGAAFGTAIYVDGVLRGVNATKPVLASNDKRLFIGENPEARNREFKGELDDIAIWNRVVTAEEVATLYKGGAGTAISSLAGINAPIVTSVTRSGTGISVQWVPAGGTLESSPTLGAGAVWTPVGTANPASIPAGTGAAYYRVRK